MLAAALEAFDALDSLADTSAGPVEDRLAAVARIKRAAFAVRAARRAHGPAWLRELGRTLVAMSGPTEQTLSAAQVIGAAGGRRGGPAAARKMSPEQRHARAVKAAKARWGR